MHLPRTRTHVALAALGLPVLDGCLILRDSPTALASGAAYMAKYGKAIVVRSLQS
jgi:hypothetical protein